MAAPPFLTINPFRLTRTRNMSLFLTGLLLFLVGLSGLVLTAFLAYYFPANMVRSTIATGAISVGSLATQVPEKKKVVSYLFKQVFYWRRWHERVSNARLIASRTTIRVKETGLWNTTKKGLRHLTVSSWRFFIGFIKALLLPYAIAAGISVTLIISGATCLMIAFGIWVFI